MRVIVLAIISAISLASSAGPEEHISQQTCYILNAKQLSSPLAQYVPEEVCLESLIVNTSDNTLIVYSYFNSDLFHNIKLDRLSHKNENGYEFSASKVFEVKSACDGAGQTLLTIDGNTNNDGISDVAYLGVTVQVQVEHNGCNPYPGSAVFTYLRR